MRGSTVGGIVWGTVGRRGGNGRGDARARGGRARASPPCPGRAAPSGAEHPCAQSAERRRRPAAAGRPPGVARAPPARAHHRPRARARRVRRAGSVPASRPLPRLLPPLPNPSSLLRPSRARCARGGWCAAAVLDRSRGGPESAAARAPRDSGSFARTNNVQGVRLRPASLRTRAARRPLSAAACARSSAARLPRRGARTVSILSWTPSRLRARLSGGGIFRPASGPSGGPGCARRHSRTPRAGRRGRARTFRPSGSACHVGGATSSSVCARTRPRLLRRGR